MMDFNVTLDRKQKEVPIPIPIGIKAFNAHYKQKNQYF